MEIPDSLSACECMYMWRQRLIVGIFLNFSALFFEAEFLIEPSDSTRLAGQEVPEILLSLPPPWDYSCLLH